MIARDNRDRHPGQRFRVEKLGTAAARITEIGKAGEVARSGERNYHALVLAPAATDSDHTAQHGKDHVGWRALGKDACAFRITHQSVAAEDRFHHVPVESATLEPSRQPIKPRGQALGNRSNFHHEQLEQSFAMEAKKNVRFFNAFAFICSYFARRRTSRRARLVVTYQV